MSIHPYCSYECGLRLCSTYFVPLLIQVCADKCAQSSHSSIAFQLCHWAIDGSRNVFHDLRTRLSPLHQLRKAAGGNITALYQIIVPTSVRVIKASKDDMKVAPPNQPPRKVQLRCSQNLEKSSWGMDCKTGTWTQDKNNGSRTLPKLWSLHNIGNKKYCTRRKFI